MALAQLSGRSSLREVVSNLSAQTAKLYHLGSAPVSRSSLGRANEKQTYSLYESLFAKLLSRCQGLAPRHGFRFKTNSIRWMQILMMALLLSFRKSAMILKFGDNRSVRHIISTLHCVSFSKRRRIECG